MGTATTTATATTNFWHNLEKPIVALSPMDGVTDHPYRHIHKKYGHSPVVYTEFASVEGICHGASNLLKDFIYDETQRPIVAQIYGTTPKFFRQTATLLCELGFDGIDINMGCPAKNVAHSGAGAALINTPELAQQIIRATYAGIEDFYNGKNTADCPDISPEIQGLVREQHLQLHPNHQTRTKIPVSVKTRIGYKSVVIDSWIPTLLEERPTTIAIHGRTLSQHYTGLANWEYIAKSAEIIHQTSTLVLGNGDVRNYQEAAKLCQQYQLDGALLGRATFGNPYTLSKNPDNPEKSLFEIALEHAIIYENTYSKNNDKYSFLPMRKHLGWYIKSIPDATKIRLQIFASNSASEVEEIFLANQLLSEEEVTKIRTEQL